MVTCKVTPSTTPANAKAPAEVRWNEFAGDSEGRGAHPEGDRFGERVDAIAAIAQGEGALSLKCIAPVACPLALGASILSLVPHFGTGRRHGRRLVLPPNLSDRSTVRCEKPTELVTTISSKTGFGFPSGVYTDATIQ